MTLTQHTITLTTISVSCLILVGMFYAMDIITQPTSVSSLFYNQPYYAFTPYKIKGIDDKSLDVRELKEYNVRLILKEDGKKNSKVIYRLWRNLFDQRIKQLNSERYFERFGLPYQTLFASYFDKKIVICETSVFEVHNRKDVYKDIIDDVNKEFSETYNKDRLKASKIVKVRVRDMEW